MFEQDMVDAVLLGEYVKYLYENIELLIFGNIQLPLIEKETIENIKQGRIRDNKLLDLIEDLEKIYEQEKENKG